MKTSFKHELIARLFLIFLLVLFLPKVKPFQKNEIDDNKIKLEIKNVVDEAYLKNKHFLYGIKSIVISKEDLAFAPNNSGCEGQILGAYFNDTILLKDSGNSTNKKTIYHEIGHNVYAKFNDEARSKWEEIFEKSENFVSPYARTNANEDFAESFSCYFADVECKLEGEKLTFMEGIASI